MFDICISHLSILGRHWPRPSSLPVCRYRWDRRYWIADFDRHPRLYIWRFTTRVFLLASLQSANNGKNKFNPWNAEMCIQFILETRFDVFRSKDSKSDVEKDIMEKTLKRSVFRMKSLASTNFGSDIPCDLQFELNWNEYLFGVVSFNCSFKL